MMWNMCACVFACRQCEHKSPAGGPTFLVSLCARSAKEPGTSGVRSYTSFSPKAITCGSSSGRRPWCEDPRSAGLQPLPLPALPAVSVCNVSPAHTQVPASLLQRTAPCPCPQRIAPRPCPAPRACAAAPPPTPPPSNTNTHTPPAPPRPHRHQVCARLQGHAHKAAAPL